jgi:anthranilate phosphoribosyltransferase
LMADALAALGTQRSVVVHGHDGLDEVSTTGPTDVWEVTPSGVEKHLWTPADFGVPRATLKDLAGGDPELNARLIERLLAGQAGPPRDIVIVNAAAGLVAAGLAENLREAAAIAAQAIDSGAAANKLSLLKHNFPIS